MGIDRNEFIQSLARSTPSLNLVFLNHSGSPDKLLTDLSSIDLLADKKAQAAFISFCSSHPLVRRVSEFPQFRAARFTVELNDGSEAHVVLIRSMIRKTLLCLHVNAIRQESFIDNHGMLVAAHHHHFDYLILKNQFAGQPLADRYRNYFSSFDTAQRAVIFKYMQMRYHLVYNTLEDLYKPTSKILLNMMVGLRGERRNTLVRMLLRSVETTFFNVFGFIARRSRVFEAAFTRTPHSPMERPFRKSRQAIL